MPLNVLRLTITCRAPITLVSLYLFPHLLSARPNFGRRGWPLQCLYAANRDRLKTDEPGAGISFL
ncbi:MAG: hypothetical protein CSA32_01605 [Desulfobulbus propionicus]|nr:MAG: hypothetical protein CSA32_01605 [Desulfobulbus propionicus]